MIHASTPPSAGIKQVKNCCVTIDQGEETVLCVYAPYFDDKDSVEVNKLTALMNVMSRTKIRNGTRLVFDKKTIKHGTLDIAVQTLTDYFAKRYPHNTLHRLKTYPCGNLTVIEEFFVDDEIQLHYCEELRKDFTKNYLYICYNTKTLIYPEIFFNTYEFGTLEIKDGSMEMHRWESEDESQETSYLNKRHTLRMLDGIVTGGDTKANILKTIVASLNTKTIDDEDAAIISKALTLVVQKQGSGNI